MRAIRAVFLRPIFFQVSPPSIDLYIPSPIACAGLIINVSPVPAHNTLGFFCEIAKALTEETS